MPAVESTVVLRKVRSRNRRAAGWARRAPTDSAPIDRRPDGHAPWVSSLTSVPTLRAGFCGAGRGAAQRPGGAPLPASCGEQSPPRSGPRRELQLPGCPASGDHDSQSAPRARGLQMGAGRANPPVSGSRSDPATGHGQAWRARADWRHGRRVGYGGRQGAAAVGLGSRGGTAGLGRGEPGGLRLGRGEVRAGS